MRDHLVSFWGLNQYFFEILRFHEKYRYQLTVNFENMVADIAATFLII